MPTATTNPEAGPTGSVLVWHQPRDDRANRTVAIGDSECVGYTQRLSFTTIGHAYAFTLRVTGRLRHH